MTVKSIAKRVYDRLETRFPDVIKDATLTKRDKIRNNPSTGKPETADPQTYQGRAFFDTDTVIADQFPDFKQQPQDKLAWLEGFSVEPKKGDTILIGGKNYMIGITGDIVGAGTFFAAIVSPN